MDFWFSFDPIDPNQIKALVRQATNEGLPFLEPDGSIWPASEVNSNASDDMLIKAMSNKQLVGIALLRKDPWISDSKIGRISHVYVLPEFRQAGIAKQMLSRLLDKKHSFQKIRLVTENSIAVRLYESFGFVASNEYKSTHVLLVEIF